MFYIAKERGENIQKKKNEKEILSHLMFDQIKFSRAKKLWFVARRNGFEFHVQNQQKQFIIK